MYGIALGCDVYLFRGIFIYLEYVKTRELEIPSAWADFEGEKCWKQPANNNNIINYYRIQQIKAHKQRIK